MAAPRSRSWGFSTGADRLMTQHPSTWCRLWNLEELGATVLTAGEASGAIPNGGRGGIFNLWSLAHVSRRFARSNQGRLCWNSPMPHGFDAYRVFISAPGDLERDRAAAYEAVSRANESVAMPAKILLVSVGLRENGQFEAFRSITSDNVRWSTFFVQVFEDDWGPRDLFRKLFRLALECRDDPSMPMRDVVVCLKSAAGETDREILAFRKELEEEQGTRLFHYRRPEELSEQLKAVCEDWAKQLIALGSPALGAS